MTTVCALALAGLFTALKDTHAMNESIFNKRAILAAVMDRNELAKMSDQQVQDVFNNQVQQYVLDANGNAVDEAAVQAAGYKGGHAEDVDMAKEKKKPVAERLLPLFVYTNQSGDKDYILAVRGNGLWDEIWGSIALKSDLNTIEGASFDHKGETPGLGAEIKDNPKFPAQFKGEKIYDDQGNYVSVHVVKGGAKPDDLHGVDGISGATITGNGVSAMLENGLKLYEPYFKKVKAENAQPVVPSNNGN